MHFGGHWGYIPSVPHNPNVLAPHAELHKVKLVPARPNPRFAYLGLGASRVWEFLPSSSFSLDSFPIPIVFFYLKEGQRVDFPFAVFTSVITIIALATLPIWLVK